MICVFLLIATHPTLAAAARYLGVTPPSVTQRLQELNSVLGVRLIQRPSRFILTDEGCLVKPELNESLKSWQTTGNHQNRRRRGQREIKRPGPVGICTDYVAPLLGEYSSPVPASGK